MKKIYVAVVLLVSILLTGYVAGLVTDGINADTRSGSAQFGYSRHLDSVSSTSMNSSDAGFSSSNMVAYYSYSQNIFSANITVSMPYIAGNYDYWADASTAYFKADGQNIGGDVEHKDYPTGCLSQPNLSLNSTYSKVITPKLYRATTYPTVQDYSDLSNQNTYFWQIDACPANYNTGH